MKVFELQLSETPDAGVTAISLVEFPATEELFIAFNKDPERLDRLVTFRSIDDEQQIVMGAAMVPDKQIYRRDGDDEFFVFFKADTIRRIAEKFFLDGKINSATVEHVDTLNGVTVVESWIVEDPERDKSTVYGFSYPAGTWVISMKINNPDIWAMVKNDMIRGFSVEGIFANQLIKNSSQMDIEQLSSSIAEKIKKLFEKAPEVDPKNPEKENTEFGNIEATAVDGSVIMITYPGEAIAEGDAVTFDLEGEQVPVPSGEYMLADGRSLMVAEDGVAGTITEPAEMGKENAVDMDAILEAVAGVLDGLFDEFLTQTKASQEEFVKIQLESFRKELDLPGDEPIVKGPGSPRERNTFKSLNAKIKERKEA